jgi:hypothetical protein
MVSRRGELSFVREHGGVLRQRHCRAPLPCASVRRLGHVGEVEEIKKLYLMQQTYGTGQVLGVDGGGALAWKQRRACEM